MRPRPSGRCPTASRPSRPVTPSSTARSTAGTVAAKPRRQPAQPSVPHRRHAMRPPPRRASDQDRETLGREPSRPIHRRARNRPPRPINWPGSDRTRSPRVTSGLPSSLSANAAYLAPHDPVAQLHLGLALDAAGDESSAQRAYAAARHALLNADPAHSRCRHRGLRHR